jgi:uncharacterized membrane protein YeaQ/YmgE (transglycosylase-associated protein family)
MLFQRGFIGALGAACLLSGGAFYLQNENLVGLIFGLIGAILVVIVLRSREHIE